MVTVTHPKYRMQVWVSDEYRVRLIEEIQKFNDYRHPVDWVNRNLKDISGVLVSFVATVDEYKHLIEIFPDIYGQKEFTFIVPYGKLKKCQAECKEHGIDEFKWERSGTYYRVTIMAVPSVGKLIEDAYSTL